MSNIGLRIFTKIHRPEAALIQGFTGIPVANISDNMQRMACMDARIRPVNSVPLLGPAITVKSRPGDNLMLYKAIDLAQPGDIVVLNAQEDVTNSVMGELMATWAKNKGVGGFVIDGAIRDYGALKNLDLPVYAAGITPAGPYKDGPGEINVPISCGGLIVNPGDIVVGDDDGIVVINQQEAAEILELAKATLLKEQKTMEQIQKGTFDVSWLNGALEKRGVAVINDVCSGNASK